MTKLHVNTIFSEECSYVTSLKDSENFPKIQWLFWDIVMIYKSNKFTFV